MFLTLLEKPLLMNFNIIKKNKNKNSQKFKNKVLKKGILTQKSKSNAFLLLYKG